MMTPEVRSRIKHVFFEVSEAPAQDRERLLADLCGDDYAVRSHVIALLEVEGTDAAARADAPSTFLERPIMGRLLPSAALGEAAFEAVGEVGGGAYRIVRRVGEGGMGTVYEAEQRSPKRRVALKFVRAGLGSPAVMRRFRHEAEILGSLDHPGIARIYEAGTTSVTHNDGSRSVAPFLAMEFVDGEPITAFVEQRRLSLRERLELIVRVCEAVEHAQQRGVIHRDLKPSNILVVGSGQPKVLDFGVARLTSSGSGDNTMTVQTQTGAIVGTLAYMSPEQVAGDPRQVGARSDVYALGVIAYQLLSQKLPIDVSGKTIAECARLVAEQQPSRLGSVDASLRGDVETLVAKAMEKEQARRYSSAAEFAEDIRRHLRSEPIVARPASAIYVLRKFSRRNRAALTGAALALIGLIGGLGYGLLKTREERDTARAALTEAKEAREEEAVQKRIAEEINTFFNDELLLAVNPETAANPDIRMRDVLDAASSKIEGRFVEEPLVEARIRMTMGSTYMRLSEFATARRHMDRALELRRAHMKPTDQDLLFTYVEVAGLTYHQGDHAKAEKLYEEGAPLIEAALGADHDLALAARANLAFIKLRLHKYAEAEPLLLEAAEKRRKTASPELAVIMINLAMLYLEQKRYALAEPAFDEAIARCEADLGPENAQTLIAKGSRGALLNAMERYGESIPALMETIRSMERVLGPVHAQTLVVKGNLAFAYQRLGELEKAEPLLMDLLREQRPRFGDAHPHTLNTISKLGDLRVNQERYDEGEALLLEGVRHTTSEQGVPKSPLYGMFARALEDLYTKKGDAASAEVWRQRMAEASK